MVGGGGFVGSRLVEELLKYEHMVVVYDLFLYSKPQHQDRLINIKEDIRNLDAFKAALIDVDAVVHLACISNDPSFDLDPELGKSINWDCFSGIVKACIGAKVKRFVYASSSSVYGNTEGLCNVVETYPCKPITDYARYKWACEQVLVQETDQLKDNDFHYAIVRPGTICGPSKSMRLDLTVNGYINEAWNTDQITVKGGQQMRANLDIRDMVDAYLALLRAPTEMVAGQVFNVANECLSTIEIATKVAGVVGRFKEKAINIKVIPDSVDMRSYHVCSTKFNKFVKPLFSGFPSRSLWQSITDTTIGFQNDMYPNSMRDDRYYRVRALSKLTEQLKWTKNN